MAFFKVKLYCSICGTQGLLPLPVARGLTTQVQREQRCRFFARSPFAQQWGSVWNPWRGFWESSPCGSCRHGLRARSVVASNQQSQVSEFSISRHPPDNTNLESNLNLAASTAVRPQLVCDSSQATGPRLCVRHVRTRKPLDHVQCSKLGRI